MQSIQRKSGESDESLRGRVKKHMYNQSTNEVIRKIKTIKNPQLFGQPSREFGEFGQLRRQKKEPHKEVLYIPVAALQDLKDGTQHVGGHVMRSINNASNDQLTDHVKKVASAMESGELPSSDAEALMDIIYAEIAIRVQSAEVIRAMRTQAKNL